MIVDQIYSHYKGVVNALLGVALGLATNFLWERLSIRLPSMKPGQREDIAGIWVTRFNRPQFPDRKVIEVIKVRERGGNVSLYIEHYRSMEVDVLTLAGRGVFIGKTLSLFFYFTAKYRGGGTATCTRENLDCDPPLLKGVFTQILDRADEKRINEQPYDLVRVNLPISRQLRRTVSLTFFGDYSQAEAFLSSLPEVFRTALPLPL